MKYLTLTLILLLCTGNAAAKVTGACADCHTMHNSQNGSVLDIADPGLNEALLNNDCLGCHTGTNDGSNTTPYIHSTGAVDYGNDGTTGDTLAGGTFKYVANGSDAMGHNVFGLGNIDNVLFTPPGYASGLAAADGTTPGNGTWPDGKQITCAGTYGCHGSHDTTSNTIAIHGAHHSDTAIGSDDSPAAGYRMLVGIEGIEDSDWEYHPDKDNHNQYKGVDQATDNSTISYLCAQCHGVFHDGSNGSPWLRHPTDYAMSNTALSSEYREYGGSNNDYLPATPLASDLGDGVISTITFTTSTNSIVTCISCHRAHGSPYYKSMRWGYAESSSGGLCVNCHTSKD